MPSGKRSYLGMFMDTSDQETTDETFDPWDTFFYLQRFLKTKIRSERMRSSQRLGRACIGRHAGVGRVALHEVVGAGRAEAVAREVGVLPEVAAEVRELHLERTQLTQP